MDMRKIIEVLMRFGNKKTPVMTAAMGSLFIDGEAVEPGGVFHGFTDFFLGDSDPMQKGIEWIPWKGLLVSTSSVAFGNSWDQLNTLGLIYGRRVSIDGHDYACRSLKVGNREGVPNEWDSLLDELGDSDDILHWGSIFWGQETWTNVCRYCAIRGCHSPRFWGNYHPAAGLRIGFRPVLEPLGPTLSVSQSREENSAWVFGPNGTGFKGRLQSIDDYDLVFSSDVWLPDNCDWAVRDGDRIAISRSSKVWLRKAIVAS